MLIFELEFSYSVYLHKGVWCENTSGFSEIVYHLNADNLEQAIERVKKRFHVVGITSAKFLCSLESHGLFNYGDGDENS